MYISCQHANSAPTIQPILCTLFTNSKLSQFYLRKPSLLSSKLHSPMWNVKMLLKCLLNEMQFTGCKQSEHFLKPQLFQRTVSKVDLAFQNRLNSLPRILVCNTEHSLYVHIRTVNLFSLMHCIKIGPKRSCPNCSLTTGNFNNSHAAQKQDHKFFYFLYIAK